MGVKGKLVVEVAIKSCGDLFHELWGKKPHQISKITPDKVHSCDVHEGDFGKPGSIICWNYTFDGKKRMAKEMVEEINEEKKYIRLKVIEGDLLEEFKNLTIGIHVIPKGATTIANWTMDFEKITDDGPYPTKLMDYCIELTYDIEAHHISA